MKKTVTIGGHRYSDPDVLSLIESDGGLLDPRLEVIRRAQSLNQQLRSWDSIDNPRKRIEILASLAGVNVLPMVNSPSTSHGREAFVFPDSGGSHQAFYDPTYSYARVNFTIAHEIVHTFFPKSINGTRFRSIHAEQSREANELEQLCHLGASELLMPQEEFLEEIRSDFGLHLVPNLAARFGSSYEATVFRLATTYNGLAVAGLLQYRYRKAEERRLSAPPQMSLFPNEGPITKQPEPKYRRQSLHTSSLCTEDHLIPWNKSFDETSCVYLAQEPEDIQIGYESLPNRFGESGNIEAVQAPYQRTLDIARLPDVLFLWWK